jgi:hypothetical protein
MREGHRSAARSRLHRDGETAGAAVLEKQFAPRRDDRLRAVSVPEVKIEILVE